MLAELPNGGPKGLVIRETLLDKFFAALRNIRAIWKVNFPSIQHGLLVENPILGLAIPKWPFPVKHLIVYYTDRPNVDLVTVRMQQDDYELAYGSRQ